MRAPSIFWFRRDLRVSDHPALLEACRRGEGRVAALFILDDALLAATGLTRALYLRDTLQALRDELGGGLLVRRGDPARVLVGLARECGASEVLATQDYSPRGRARDERVASTLGEAGLTLTLLDSPYVVPPGVVRTQSGAPCRVFRGFARGWNAEHHPAPFDEPGSVSWERLDTLEPDAVVASAQRHAPWYFGDLATMTPADVGPAGERAAHARLEDFVANVDDYAETRNLPAVDGSSRLSAFLRFGALHPRSILAATRGLERGRATFTSELCWREFYADVLFHHPESAWQSLQPSMVELRVDADERAVERFRAWALGETGYPFVDAGMRQLLAEGWIHNRVRMVVASFLVKHLHLDWRWGAKWFLWRLSDGDLASNQHGWQWTAGTGTDAAPFHRVFNPTLQGERFDPDGLYVRRYVNELRDVAAPGCLQPGGGAGLWRPAGYAEPLIDANVERREALVRFAEVRERAKVLE
ncbi:MAG TPA: deoxyribodipyrimidine photo-lyase [Acidimicrobiales bacterium]|nr:deoxyribodipyrimidine photo-lyase [Acidimicrobiales bacterium]